MSMTDESRAGHDERLLSDAEVRRIAAVHYPHHCNGLSWCGACLQDWPCHTIRFVRDRAALIEQIAAECRAQDVQISDAGRALEVLHQIHQDNGRGYCDICSERYPCSTIMEVDDLATENAQLRAALGLAGGGA